MKKYLLFAALLFITFNSAVAQFKMSVAPTAGFNLNLHSGSDIEESASALDFVSAGQIDMSFNESVGLIANLSFYDRRGASFEQNLTEDGISLTDVSDINLTYFQIEGLFKYKFPSNFYIAAGPAIGFTTTSEVEHELKINTPGYEFDNGSNTMKSTSELQNTQTRFELKLNAGYDIPVAPQISLTPQVTFGYGLSNVVENVEWKIMTFQALLGVKFAIM